MLRAASLADLDFIRRLLREGAAIFSFDPELAGDSAEATAFFANLGEALLTGYFRVPDDNGDLTGEVHVAGYVYSARDGSPPIGFGLFKALKEDGFELWLTGIAAEARGRGHGHAMIGEVMATPAGRVTCLVRCNRRSATFESAVRLFCEFGFASCRETPEVVWLVNDKAPPRLVSQISTSAVCTN